MDGSELHSEERFAREEFGLDGAKCSCLSQAIQNMIIVSDAFLITLISGATKKLPFVPVSEGYT